MICSVSTALPFQDQPRISWDLYSFASCSILAKLLEDMRPCRSCNRSCYRLGTSREARRFWARRRSSAWWARESASISASICSLARGIFILSREKSFGFSSWISTWNFTWIFCWTCPWISLWIFISWIYRTRLLRLCLVLSCLIGPQGFGFRRVGFGCGVASAMEPVSTAERWKGSPTSRWKFGCHTSCQKSHHRCTWKAFEWFPQLVMVWTWCAAVHFADIKTTRPWGNMQMAGVLWPGDVSCWKSIWKVRRDDQCCGDGETRCEKDACACLGFGICLAGGWTLPASLSNANIHYDLNHDCRTPLGLAPGSGHHWDDVVRHFEDRWNPHVVACRTRASRRRSSWHRLCIAPHKVPQNTWKGCQASSRKDWPARPDSTFISGFWTSTGGNKVVAFCSLYTQKEVQQPFVFYRPANNSDKSRAPIWPWEPQTGGRYFPAFSLREQRACQKAWPMGNHKGMWDLPARDFVYDLHHKAPCRNQSQNRTAGKSFPETLRVALGFLRSGIPAKTWYKLYQARDSQEHGVWGKSGRNCAASSINMGQQLMDQNGSKEQKKGEMLDFKLPTADVPVSSFPSLGKTRPGLCPGLVWKKLRCFIP